MTLAFNYGCVCNKSRRFKTMLKTQYIKTEYRDIAKMLVKALPVENDDFGLKVEEYTPS
jgi:hypothetical protein